MSSSYTKKLDFKIEKINIQAQKINSTTLKLLRIVIANFQIKVKADKPKFFQEPFLIADIKFEIILEKLFLKISNMHMLFSKKTLIY